jgi:hypothetical protein
VDAFRLLMTVVVLIAVAVFILLFEKKRATRIERDLSEMSRRHRQRGSEDES